MPDDASFCPKCGCNNKLNEANITIKTNTTVQSPLFTAKNQIPQAKTPAQIIRLVVEVLICLVIAVFGAMTAVFGDVKICGVLMIIMSGGLLWLLIKNPKISKKEADTNNYKLQGASRIILIIVCLISSFILFVAGMGDSSDESKVTTETESSDVIIDETTTTAPNELGDYTIAIKEHYLSKGYYDEPLLVIVYSFTNNSDKTISFSDAIEDKIFQNGVELNLYIATNIPNQVDIRDSNKEIQPGASYDVPRAYMLNFETPSAFNVELNTEFGPYANIQYTLTIE